MEGEEGVVGWDRITGELSVSVCADDYVSFCFLGDGG